MDPDTSFTSVDEDVDLMDMSNFTQSEKGPGTYRV